MKKKIATICLVLFFWSVACFMEVRKLATWIYRSIKRVVVTSCFVVLVGCNGFSNYIPNINITPDGALEICENLCAKMALYRWVGYRGRAGADGVYKAEHVYSLCLCVR